MYTQFKEALNQLTSTWKYGFKACFFGLAICVAWKSNFRILFLLLLAPSLFSMLFLNTISLQMLAEIVVVVCFRVSIRRFAVAHQAIGVTVGLSIRSAVCLGRRFLAWACNVGVVEEVKEEHEIGEVHEEGPSDVGVADLARLAALLLHVGADVDGDADDHLRDLSARDGYIHPFGNLETERTEPIVSVHARVHRVVHDDEPAARGRELRARVPAVDEHCGVVVPVKEDELLLAQHDEQSVHELGHLAQDEQP